MCQGLYVILFTVGDGSRCGKAGYLKLYITYWIKDRLPLRNWRKCSKYRSEQYTEI